MSRPHVHPLYRQPSSTLLNIRPPAMGLPSSPRPRDRSRFLSSPDTSPVLPRSSPILQSVHPSPGLYSLSSSSTQSPPFEKRYLSTGFSPTSPPSSTWSSTTPAWNSPTSTYGPHSTPKSHNLKRSRAQRSPSPSSSDDERGRPSGVFRLGRKLRLEIAQCFAPNPNNYSPDSPSGPHNFNQLQKVEAVHWTEM